MPHFPRSFGASTCSGRPALRLSLLGLAFTLVSGAVGSASGQKPDGRDVEGPSPAGLPFKAVFSATSRVEQDATRCPVGLKATVTGSGQSTQLGMVTVRQTHCFDPADPLSFTDGRYEWTAEDGSTITGPYGGRIIATPTTDEDGQFYIDAAFSITAGTGRLSEARGGGAASGLLTATGDAMVVLDGHIQRPRR